MTNPLKDVNNWLYHLGDIGAGKAKQIRISNADLVIIDYQNFSHHEPRPYTPAELDTMRGANDKLIVSYLSIGEAEDYRPYWKSGWGDKPPGFLSASNPEWPDNYKVKYWEKGWQDIVFKHVDDIVKAGFNGLYMDIIDGFQYWERVAPHKGIDYQQEMVDFVTAIRARAEKTLAEIGEEREFVLIGQNGEKLITNPEYLGAIDGIAKEDFRFHYYNGHESKFKPAPDVWFEDAKPYLERAEAEGVEVFVVEYMTKARQSEYAKVLQAEIDYLKANGMSLYVAEDRDLDAIYDQPAGLNGLEAPADDAPLL